MATMMGIDPGYTNLGFAMIERVEGQYKLLHGEVLSPKKLGIQGTIDAISSLIGEEKPVSLGMERYVPYQGQQNSNSENILMVTGALYYYSQVIQCNPNMYRAIDWKPLLSKCLFKQGFRNPSSKFDKDFDIAAARFILNDFSGSSLSDHIADAICLAYMGFNFSVKYI